MATMIKLADKKKQYTREVIIETAKEIFSRKGYHNTQVMDIVKAVGMSAGTFYNHFTDKRDLFEQITRDSFEELRVNIKELRSPLNIWDRNDRALKLLVTFDAYFNYLDNHKQQFLILLRSSFGIDSELDVNVWNYYKGLAQDLAEDIQRWLDLGIVEGVKAYPIAYAVVGMVMHLGHSYLVENAFSRVDAIETLVSMCMGVFDSSLTEAGKKALKEQENRNIIRTE